MCSLSLSLSFCLSQINKNIFLIKKIIIITAGHLAGSVSRACDSSSWDHDFKPHIGALKQNKNKNLK